MAFLPPLVIRVRLVVVEELLMFMGKLEWVNRCESWRNSPRARWTIPTFGSLRRKSAPAQGKGTISR